jgi:hypothetical protein
VTTFLAVLLAVSLLALVAALLTALARRSGPVRLAAPVTVPARAARRR